MFDCFSGIERIILQTWICFLFKTMLRPVRLLLVTLTSTTLVTLVYICGELHSDEDHTAAMVCTQEERIAHVRRVCQQRYDGLPENLRQTLIQEHDDVDVQPGNLSIVDHRHRLALCWMSKSGCTALKSFVLEANGMKLPPYDSPQDSLYPWIHSPKKLNKYGVHLMYQLDETYKRTVMLDYSKMMVVRHPFDRLVSVYRDKILDADNTSNHPEKVREILKEMRPEMFKNNNLSAMEWPQKAIGSPTFVEFVTWIYRQKVMDIHWSRIEDFCHPCSQAWHAILRVETMQEDSKHLARKLQLPRSRLRVRHSHQHKNDHHQMTKSLVEFSGVPEDVLDYLLGLYDVDMTTFGYRWDKHNNVAYCAIDTPRGRCC